LNTEKFRNYVLAAVGFLIFIGTVTVLVAPYAVAQMKAALVMRIQGQLSSLKHMADLVQTLSSSAAVILSPNNSLNAVRDHRFAAVHSW
jgi:hypothetical protein